MLKTHHNTDELTDYAIKYEDIYANNPKKQKQVTELYRQLLNIREQIMNSQPEAVTGPLHWFTKVCLYYHILYDIYRWTFGNKNKKLQ